VDPTDSGSGGEARQRGRPGSGPGLPGVRLQPAGTVHPDRRPLRPRPARRAAGHRPGHRPAGSMIQQAAYRRRWRPTRYWLAAMIGAALFVILVISSVASLAIGQVPLRATLFGLPGIGFVVAATFFALRALHDHEPGIRLQDATRAAALFVVGIFLWLAVLDVYTFTQQAGPRLATPSATPSLP